LSAPELPRWVEDELHRLWPGAPTWTRDLEIWGKEPEVKERGETLLSRGGLGKGLSPGKYLSLIFFHPFWIKVNY